MWKKLLIFSFSSSCLVIWFIKKHYSGRYCRCTQRLDGKVIIVTGATSGIGKETATILASKGAQLILGCRNKQRGVQVASDIRLKTGNALVQCEELDLSSFKSIIDFVNRFKQRGIPLYGLLNNAGLFHVPFQLTNDGFDLTLQTNYLGPFLLTYLMLDTLKQSAPSRIVNIGSESHRYVSHLDVDNLTKHYSEQEAFDKFEFYGTTKLCLMLMTTKLARLLKGSGVVANSVNPGNVRTQIHRHFPGIRDLPLVSFSRFLLWLTFKTPYQGAQTSVHLLTNLELSTVTGKYFSDCIEKEVSNLANSTTLEEILWEKTLSWLQLLIEKK